MLLPTKMLEDNLSVWYVALSLIVVIVLVVLLATLSKKNEAFCQCRAEGQKVCPSTHVLTNLYNDGKLTENSPFAKWQREQTKKLGPQYKEVEPYDFFEARQRGEDPYTISH